MHEHCNMRKMHSANVRQQASSPLQHSAGRRSRNKRNGSMMAVNAAQVALMPNKPERYS